MLAFVGYWAVGRCHQDTSVGAIDSVTWFLGMMSWLPRLGSTGSPTLASSSDTLSSVASVSSRLKMSSGP